MRRCFGQGQEVDGNRIFNVDTAVEIFIDLDILVGVLRADLIEVIGFGEEPGGAGDRTNHRREGGGNNVETDDLVSITAQGADERLTQMARTSGYQDLSVLHLAHNKPAPAIPAVSPETDPVFGGGPPKLVLTARDAPSLGSTGELPQ